MRLSGGAQEGCGEHLSNTASLSKPRCRWSIEQTARVSTTVPTSTWFTRISLGTKCQGALFSALKRTCDRQEEQIKRKPKEGDECVTASARSSVEEIGWGEIDWRERERSNKCLTGHKPNLRLVPNNSSMVMQSRKQCYGWLIVVELAPQC